MDLSELRKRCSSGAVRWSDHALKRLMIRGISQSEVLQAILSGCIIEEYPDDYPYPSCLVLGNGLHVVCGIGQGLVWIITAYIPDPEKWEFDLKTRRRENK